MTQPTQDALSSVFTNCARLSTTHIRMLVTTHRIYVVFLTPRSGSTWLTYQARKSGLLGTPQEWFNEDFIQGNESVLDCTPPRPAGIVDINEYITRIVTTTATNEGIAGVQLSRYQAETLCSACENPDALLRRVTPFYLRRKNIVAQAISLYRSAESGYFHSYQSDGRNAFSNIEYDETKIRNTIWFLLHNETWFEWMIRHYRLSPLRFTYEDMQKSMPATLSWMYQTLTTKPAWINASEDGRVTKISDERSLEWEERFRDSHSSFLREREMYRPPFKTDTGLIALLKSREPEPL